jgi:aminocarboxymuconate-semialdehyde decarboxylase
LRYDRRRTFVPRIGDLHVSVESDAQLDTCVFRSEEVDALVAQAGAERVMLGSDYPFDMGDRDPLGLVKHCNALDSQQKRLVTGDAAAKLFGI